MLASCSLWRTLIEAICPKFGCHVGLTGGLLYKSGDRKDADILFYRIRQVTEIDVDGLMEALAADLAIVPSDDHGWCYKATWHGKPIDFFFPERGGVDAPGYTEPDSLMPAPPAVLTPDITF